MSIDKTNNIDSLISNLNLNEHNFNFQQQQQIQQIISTVNKTPSHSPIIPKCPNAPKKQKYSNKLYKKMKPRVLFLNESEFQQYNQNISPLIKFKPLNLLNKSNTLNNGIDGPMTICIPSNNNIISSPKSSNSQILNSSSNLITSPKSSPTLSSTSPTSKINLSLSLRV